MRSGDFEAAWKQTDRLEIPRRRTRRQESVARPAWHLVWDGSSFAGKRVLVRCEHGLGDTLQFIRYVPLVRELARSVTVLAQPALLPLLGLMPEFGEVRDAWSGEAFPEADVEIECMELAYAFRSTVETLPRRVPYLSPAAIRAAGPPAGLPGAGKRVGLIWASSSWDSSRSLAPGDLMPLSNVPAVSWFSLQQGPEADEAGSAPIPICPLSSRTRGTLEAAAAMLELDLIITVDTMAAHLAGALGRPVWLLLREDADWRWMRDRRDCPWYPTMRIFRRTARGGWQRVMDEVATSLRG